MAVRYPSSAQPRMDICGTPEYKKAVLCLLKDASKEKCRSSALAVTYLGAYKLILERANIRTLDTTPYIHLD